MNSVKVTFTLKHNFEKQNNEVCLVPQTLRKFLQISQLPFRVCGAHSGHVP